MSGEACLSATKAGKNVCGSLLRKVLHYLCCIALLLGDGNAVRAFSAAGSNLTKPIESVSQVLEDAWHKAFSTGASGLAPLPNRARASGTPAFGRHTYLNFQQGDYHHNNDLVLEGTVHLNVGGTFHNSAKFGGREGTKVDAENVRNVAGQIGEGGETSLQVTHTLNNLLASKQILGDRSTSILGDQVDIWAQDVLNGGSFIAGRKGTKIKAQNITNQAGQIGENGPTLLHAQKSFTNKIYHYSGQAPRGSKLLGETVAITAQELTNDTSHIAGQKGTHIRTKHMNNAGSHTGGCQTTSIVTDTLVNQGNAAGKVPGIGGDQVHLVATGLLSNLKGHIIGGTHTEITATNFQNEARDTSGAYVGSAGLTKIIAGEMTNAGNAYDHSTIEGDNTQISVGGTLINQKGRLSGRQSTSIQGGTIHNTQGGIFGDGGPTSVKANANFYNIGSEVKGGTALYIWVGENLVSQSTLKSSSSSFYGHSHTQTQLDQPAKFAVTQATGAGTLQVEAQKDMQLIGMALLNEGAGELRVWAGGKLSILALKTGEEIRNHKREGKNHETHYEAHTRSLGTQLEGNGPVRTHSGGDSVFRNGRLQGSEVEISAGGNVFFHAEKDTDVAHTHRELQNWFRRYVKDFGSTHERVQQSTLLSSGPVKISAGGRIEVDKAGDMPLDPGLARALQGGGQGGRRGGSNQNVVYHPITEDHHEWVKRHWGLTSTGAAVVSLTVAAATWSVGASVASALGFVPETMGFVVTQAGVQAAIANVSVEVVNNQGNIAKTLEALATLDTLKSIAGAMLTAGVTHGVLNALKIPAIPRVDQTFQNGVKGAGFVPSASMPPISGFAARLPAHAVMGITSTFINGLLHGPEAMGRAALNAFANAIGTEASLVLGPAYHGGGIPGWAHKLGHGAVGCVTGAIAGAADHAGKGCASGAAGAVVGEIVGEEYLKLRIPRLFGGDTTFGEILHQTTNVSRLAGGLAAGAVGGDANIGAQTAGVAVQNNAIQNLIPLMVSAAYVTYEGDGNPLDGLAKVGSGDHSLGKAIDSGKASVVQVAYENFPEATEKAAKLLAPVGKALAVPYEAAEKVVTFLDTATGQIISRKWNSLDPYTQNLIKGFGKIISVTYIAKQAGAILNISKELDKAKLAQVARERGKIENTVPSNAKIYRAHEIGPLGDSNDSFSPASTFRSGTYSEKIAETDLLLYRDYGGKANATGRFWTLEPSKGPLQAQMDSAILPEWGNTFDHRAILRLPKGTIYYEGHAAPQIGYAGTRPSLSGGGMQIFIPSINESWIMKK